MTLKKSKCNHSEDFIRIFEDYHTLLSKKKHIQADSSLVKAHFWSFKLIIEQFIKANYYIAVNPIKYHYSTDQSGYLGSLRAIEHITVHSSSFK